MKLLSRTHTLAMLLALAAPLALSGQRKASERGTVSQVIDGTRITVDYSRPSARGRTEIFGGVIHWGEMWTPGANWATTLEVSKDVKLNGHDVPAGKYTLWMEPQPEGWTVHLNHMIWRFHTEPPEDTAEELLSFPVQSEQGAHMEALAFYFPEVTFNHAVLRMHWGTTFVPLEFDVPEWKPMEVAPGQLAAYEGEYEWSEIDSDEVTPVRVVVDEGGQSLRLFFGEGQGGGMALIPVGLHVFNDADYKDGVMWEVGIENPWTFELEDGVVTSFRGELDNGKLFGRAHRIN